MGWKRFIYQTISCDIVTPMKEPPTPLYVRLAAEQARLAGDAMAFDALVAAAQAGEDRLDALIVMRLHGRPAFR